MMASLEKLKVEQEVKILENQERDLKAEIQELEDLNRDWNLIVAREILSECSSMATLNNQRAQIGKILADLKECNVAPYGAHKQPARGGHNEDLDGLLKAILGSSPPSQKCLDLVNETTRWKRRRDTTFVSQTLSISADGEVVKRHKTEWEHLWHPEVVVLVDFNSEEILTGGADRSQGATKVTNLNIAVELEDTDLDEGDTGVKGSLLSFPLLRPNEVEPLISLCEGQDDGCDLPYFFACLDRLVCAGERRRSTLRDVGISAPTVDLGSVAGGLLISFHDSSTGFRLLTVHWDLICPLSGRGGSGESSSCLDLLSFHFTNEAKLLAEECNLPEEVISGNLCERWTVREHLENLLKMVSLGIHPVDDGGPSSAQVTTETPQRPKVNNSGRKTRGRILPISSDS